MLPIDTYTFVAIRNVAARMGQLRSAAVFHSLVPIMDSSYTSLLRTHTHYCMVDVPVCTESFQMDGDSCICLSHSNLCRPHGILSSRDSKYRASCRI